MSFLDISEEIRQLGAQAEKAVRPYFDAIDEISEYNTEKVLAAFAKNRVAEAMFAGTTGYGYDDKGRDTLDQIYADIFGTEAALVRIGFVNGTHALCCAMYSAVKTGDVVLSATGPAYDTLMNTITGDMAGSMKQYGIGYRQVEMKNGLPDVPAIAEAAKAEDVKLVFIQRSKGYGVRESLSCEQIGEVCQAVRAVNKDAVIMVDNCYGEFVEKLEPTQVGADIIAGSLIKNPGGGIAKTGGYIAGKRELIEKCAYRLTCPGVGGEVGATLGHTREMFLGAFNAPHAVGEALKTAVFTSALFSLMGFDTTPEYNETRHDIIQAVKLTNRDNLIAFCRGLQKYSPIDSFVVPEPSDMPGYDSQVIMAAGAFTLGSTIEISADAPLREPYAVWLQGGLNFHSAKVSVMSAASEVLKINGKLC